MQDDRSKNPYSILLVDDDPDEAKLTRKALMKNNTPVRIHDVPDGSAAMRYLRMEGEYQEKSRPDLILLDLNMPRMDGWEVLAEIKKDELLRSIPVIVFTMSSRQEDIAQAYSLHANCYIVKPSGWKELKRVMKCIEGFWFSIASLPGG